MENVSFYNSKINSIDVEINEESTIYMSNIIFRNINASRCTSIICRNCAERVEKEHTMCTYKNISYENMLIKETIFGLFQKDNSYGMNIIDSKLVILLDCWIDCGKQIDS